MKLDDLDEVTKLRNYRQRAMKLRDASDGYPLNLTLGWGPDPIEVGSIISVVPVRETIKREAEAAIYTYDVRLRELGVEP